MSDIRQRLSDEGAKLTLFAPVDSAFVGNRMDLRQTNLLRHTMLYHILPGVYTDDNIRGLEFAPTLLSPGAYVNTGGNQVMQLFSEGDGIRIFSGPTGETKYLSSTVGNPITCSNGIIHLVDRVLPMPLSVSETAQRGGLTEMLSKLRKEGLLDLTENTPGVTIIAPTNAAFQKFADWVHSPRGRAANVNLREVLMNHLVRAPDVMFTTKLNELAASGTPLTTMSGQQLVFSRQGNRLLVNGAAFERSNILVKNGVVHVIDRVLGVPF